MSWFLFRRFQFKTQFRRFWFVLVQAFPPDPTPAIPEPKHPGGIFLEPRKSSKMLPKPPKRKTSKTHINKPFQELSLKPPYSSLRKDAHSWILVPKAPNRAKIEFPGPNVRLKIWFHPVPVTSSSGSIRFHVAPSSTQFWFQIAQLTVLQFASRLSC